MISVSSGNNIVVSCNGKLSTQLGKLFIYDSDDRCNLPGDQPSCPTLESTIQESGKLIEVGSNLVFGMTETDYYLADIGSSPPTYLYRYDFPHVTINNVPHPYTAFGSTLDYFRRAHLVKDSSNRVYFLLEHTDGNNVKIVDLCRIDPDSDCCNNTPCGSKGSYVYKPCIEKLLSNIGDAGYLVFKGNDLYLYGFSSGVIKKISNATSLTATYICPAIEYDDTTTCP